MEQHTCVTWVKFKYDEMTSLSHDWELDTWIKPNFKNGAKYVWPGSNKHDEMTSGIYLAKMSPIWLHNSQKNNILCQNTGWFFSLVPPNFSTKMKIANQPITAAVPVYPVTKKGRDWLLGSFLIGIEIRGYQWKKSPCTFSGIRACIDQTVWAMRLNSFATRNPFCDLSK